MRYFWHNVPRIITYFYGGIFETRTFQMSTNPNHFFWFGCDPGAGGPVKPCLGANLSFRKIDRFFT